MTTKSNDSNPSDVNSGPFFVNDSTTGKIRELKTKEILNKIIIFVKKLNYYFPWG